MSALALADTFVDLKCAGLEHRERAYPELLYRLISRQLDQACALRLYPEAQRDWEAIVKAVPGEHDPSVPHLGLRCAGCNATRNYEAAAREAAAGSAATAQWWQAIGDAWYQRAGFFREGLEQPELEPER